MIEAVEGQRAWELIHWERPWTLNAERARHWMEHRRITTEWREAWHILAMAVPLPKKLERVRIIATPIRANRSGGRQDVGACFPAVKAAIDGLIDYGMCVNDGPDHVVELVFRTQRPAKLHGLELRIEEL